MSTWHIIFLVVVGWLLVVGFTLWRFRQINKATITCPVCGLVSHNRMDMMLGYCRDCDDFTTHHE